MITKQLLDLNRRFYTEYGREFSATRGRLQTGVLHVIESLRGDETILDLGCGNGELARTLSRRGHHGSYLGLDFSLPLLDEAGREAFAFPVQFMQADLVSSDWDVIARGVLPQSSPLVGGDCFVGEITLLAKTLFYFLSILFEPFNGTAHAFFKRDLRSPAK